MNNNWIANGISSFKFVAAEANVAKPSGKLCKIIAIAVNKPVRINLFFLILLLSSFINFILFSFLAEW